MSNEKLATPKSNRFVVDLSNQSDGDPFSAVKVTPPVEDDPVSVEPPVEGDPPVAVDPPANDYPKPDPEGGTGESDEEDNDEPPEEGDPIEKNNEGPSADDDSDDEDVNPYFYLGNQLRSDGFLDEDFEVGEDVSGGDVYNAYRDKLHKELEPQVRQAVYSKLAEEGVNERDILIGRAARMGVDMRLLNQVGLHEKYSSLDDEAPEQDKKDAVLQMYLARNFSATEAENQLDIYEKSDKFDELYNQAKSFHTQQLETFVENQKQQTALAQQQYEEQQQQTEQMVRSTLSGRKLYGEEFTVEQAKELENAIFNRNVIMDVQGQKVPVTELQAFLTEFETNPELKLYMFKKYKYREVDTEQIKKQVEKAVEDDLLKGYKTAVAKDSRASHKKRVKKKLESEEQNTSRGKSFIIDFDQRAK